MAHGKLRACAADLAMEQAMIVDDGARIVTANRHWVLIFAFVELILLDVAILVNGERWEEAYN
jgi:hypothetical protein